MLFIFLPKITSLSATLECRLQLSSFTHRSSDPKLQAWVLSLNLRGLHPRPHPTDQVSFLEPCVQPSTSYPSPEQFLVLQTQRWRWLPPPSERGGKVPVDSLWRHLVASPSKYKSRFPQHSQGQEDLGNLDSHCVLRSVVLPPTLTCLSFPQL